MERKVTFKFKVCISLFLLLILSSFSKDSGFNWVKNLSNKYANQEEFIQYWWNSTAMKNYETTKHIPQEVIMAKMWLETQGGLAGAGRRGAIFGIKGEGIKGYDPVDVENVEYQSYNFGWQALSHFCDLINNEPELLESGNDKIDNKLYYERFLAWKEVHPNYPDWKNRLLSLQVHPQREKSKLAYAMVGCHDGTNKKCYQIRKKHALKCIKWVENNLVGRHKD